MVRLVTTAAAQLILSWIRIGAWLTSLSSSGSWTTIIIQPSSTGGTGALAFKSPPIELMRGFELEANNHDERIHFIAIALGTTRS